MTNPNSQFGQGAANQIANALQAQGLQNQFTQSVFNAWFAGVDSFKQTAAEIAASVTPVNYAYPSHTAVGYVLLERYGGVGDNSTINNTAFINACLVAGQVDAPIALAGGSAAVYKFTAGLTMTGTGQALAGIGPPVGGAGAQGARLVGLNGRPVLSFSGLGSTTDCITLGGASLPQVELRNLQIQCNGSIATPNGRDGVVILGSNAPIVDNVIIANSQRDGFVLSPNGSTGTWIEKGKFKTLMLRLCGRHGVTLSLSGGAGTTPYVNECTWEHLELRGCSQITAGGIAFYMTSVAGLSGASKISNHLFLDPNIDAAYSALTPLPGASPFTIDSGVAQNFAIIGGGQEDAEITTIATTGASGTGTTATVTFGALASAIPVGASVLVSGVTPTGYNGFWTVTASSTTSVSFANTTTGAQTVAGTVIPAPPLGYACHVTGTGQWGGLLMLANLTNSFWGAGLNGLVMDPAITGANMIDFSSGRTQLNKIASLFSQPTILEDLFLFENKNVFGGTFSLKKTHVKTSAPASQTDGVPADGMLHASVSGATSSTCHLQFPLALISPVPQVDFVHAFSLVLSNSSFANFNGNISEVYLLQVAPNLTTTLLTSVKSASSAGQIASVTASIVSTTTVDIAITTGATFGTGGANTTIYGNLHRGAFVQ